MSELHAVGGRTPGSGRRAEVSEVLALLESRTSALPGEAVPLHESAGRVLSVAVVANVNVPGFAKSAMDGFAVCASDTTGASPDAPRTLAILGESLPARPFGGEVKPGQAVRILTGAPFPAGADAVLVSESATLDGTRVLAHEAVPPGKHVIRVGEDVAKGSVVLPSGRLLRPQDVGLLASIGVSSVEVVRRPRVAILVTGNELLPPGTAPAGFQIVDSNSPMLAALAARAGATVLPVRAAPDAPAAIRTAFLSAAAEADVILATGGTSVGPEDHAPRVAAALGELAVHGVAIRPAAPLGIAFLPKAGGERRNEETGDKLTSRQAAGLEGGSALPPPCSPSAGIPFSLSPPLPVFLLPGNPVACLCAYDLFAGRVVRRLGGRSWALPYRKEAIPLARGITSAAGRVDYVRVKVEGGEAVPLAAGAASSLSTAVAADGFVLAPRDRVVVTAGEAVDVWLYDG